MLRKARTLDPLGRLVDTNGTFLLFALRVKTAKCIPVPHTLGLWA